MHAVMTDADPIEAAMNHIRETEPGVEVVGARRGASSCEHGCLVVEVVVMEEDANVRAVRA